MQPNMFYNNLNSGATFVRMHSAMFCCWSGVHWVRLLTEPMHARHSYVILQHQNEHTETAQHLPTISAKTGKIW